jgi:hypothetical protein
MRPSHSERGASELRGNDSGASHVGIWHAGSRLPDAVRKRDSLLLHDQKADFDTQEQKPDFTTRDAKLEDSLQEHFPASIPKRTSHVSCYAYAEVPPDKKPARTVLEVLEGIPVGTPVEEIKPLSDALGLDFCVKAVAKIESDFDPKQRTGSYMVYSYSAQRNTSTIRSGFAWDLSALPTRVEKEELLVERAMPCASWLAVRLRCTKRGRGQQFLDRIESTDTLGGCRGALTKRIILVKDLNVFFDLRSLNLCKGALQSHRA